MDRNSLLLGCDMMGNIVAAIASRLTSTPFVHYSLELPTKHGEGKSPLRWLEHWSYRRADLVVTMDQAHADFISAETRVSPGRIALVPNTLRGPGLRRSSASLRTRFDLELSSILILHAGGIGAAQASIPVAHATVSWNPNWHLVFHAHCDMSNEPYSRSLTRLAGELPNVHLSGDPVSPNQLDDLIGSADIGLAWYDRELLGYRADLLGLAAGKIGRYLRNGKPIVVRNLPTIREYVDRYKCGICVDDVEQIEAAVGSILANLDAYSENALRCYEEVWRPDRYLSEVQRRVEELFKQRV